VPAAAGGTTDVMGRLLAAHLQTAWGQSAVVENRSGGGGTIGTIEVIRQKGDGHTILIGNPGPNAIAYSIFRNLNYKADQLQAVSNLIRTPNIVSAHPSTGIKSIAELIAYIKPTRTNELRVLRVGQSPHLTGAWFLQLTGLKMVHVPFRGAGPALQAALAGDIQILFDNLFPSLPQTQEGKLTALAVTTPERSAVAPNIPTMRESAPELANFDVSSWFGVFLPKAAPAPVVDALNKEIKTMLERDDIQEDHRRHGRAHGLGNAAAIRGFRSGRNHQVRRDHQARRPADGRELKGTCEDACLHYDDLLIFLTLASVASIDRASSRMALDSSSLASFWSCDLEARSA
jgi:tripartite-type tricarboxylate transporter receptor subunit TctC